MLDYLFHQVLADRSVSRSETHTRVHVSLRLNDIQYSKYALLSWYK